MADYEGSSNFFIASTTADSSLQKPGGGIDSVLKVEVATLDRALEPLGFREISVLKVEAEGGEPEVLRGARESLSRTRVCVVDAGPERGGLSTAPQCIAILQNAGFELVDVRFPRGILVFVNLRPGKISS